MRVKFLAQEHSAVHFPGLDPDSSALTIRPPGLPLVSFVMQHSCIRDAYSFPAKQKPKDF